MGNATSTVFDRQQSAPFSRTRDGSGLPGGREREQSASSSEVPKGAVARYITPQSTPQSRIVVDIRSANLDRDYNVYIKQEPQREIDVASAWTGIQALGALCITVLTIQKLWEDIKFIRLLRRELSTIVGSLTDSGGGLDTGNGDGSAASRPARARGASGRSNASTFSPSPAAAAFSAPGPAARQLDIHFNELSELLGGGSQGGRRQAAANLAAGAAAGASSKGSQQLQSAAAAANISQVARKETTWSSISGLMEVKILLQEATVLPTLRPDLFQGIRQPPRALLLFGPPGTGKTLLARAVATESRASFFPVTGSSVLSMWYGQSEQNVKSLFEKARKRQPAIIFIDEVDSLLGKRSSGGPRDSTPDKRVTNEFLAFIDGIQTQQAGGSGGGDVGDTSVVVIAATNTPWDLDEAALSRFSRRIYVPLPDKATREALMRRAMEGIACDVSDEDWRRLAERCDKYSGRDLVQVCREAAMRPLRELWGRRLLEGSQAASDSEAGPGPKQTAAAQQRLVDLVAKSLATTVKETVAARCPAASPAGCGPQGAAAAAVKGAGSLLRGGDQEAVAARNLRGGWLRRFRPRWAGLGVDRYVQSKKQARRELERWKRRHGASWCDVDAIMEQAERLVESWRQHPAAPHSAAQADAPEAEAAGTAGAAAPAEASSDLPTAHKQQEAHLRSRVQESIDRRRQQASPQEQHHPPPPPQEEGCQQGVFSGGLEEPNRSCLSGPGSASSSSSSSSSSGPPALAAEPSASEAPRVESRGGREGAVRLRLVVEPDTDTVTAGGEEDGKAMGEKAGAAQVMVRLRLDVDVDVDEGGAPGELSSVAPQIPLPLPLSLPLQSGWTSSGKGTTEELKVGSKDSTATTDAVGGVGGVGGDAQTPLRICSAQDGSLPSSSSRSASSGDAAGGGTASSESDAAAAGAGLVLPCGGGGGGVVGGSGSGSGSGPRAAAAAVAIATTARGGTAATAAAGGNRTGCVPALSLEGLLALPADRVRPVTAADLEAALQVISCTEMDQTAKYTEWDQQYGSGATESGRQGGARARVWMSMYA